MESTVRVVDVAIDPRTGGSEAIYSYLPVPGLQAGDAVIVSLGNRQILGYALGFRVVDEETLGFSTSLLKPVVDRIDGLTIPTPVLKTAEFVAEEYLCPVTVALTAATPPGVKDRLQTVWLPSETIVPNDLKPVEEEVLRALNDAGQIEISKKLAPGVEHALKALRTKGLAKQTLRLKPSSTVKKGEDTYRLTSDSDRIDQFLKREGKKKPAQCIVVMQLQQTDGSALSSNEIRAMAAVTDTTIKALVTQKILELVDQQAPQSPKIPPTPNPHQQIAIDAICHSIESQEDKPFLLYGVTGSGKTEVFLRCAAKALAAGRQVLYLVPEIALAAQAIALLRDRFGGRVAIIHSEQSALERLHNWQRIRSGEASVVLGPRSAVFSPLDNLGLIIMDEEHENGYKQEQSPRYHARTVARFLSTQHSCPIVLGSATPSTESFFEADLNESAPRADRLTLLSLPARAATKSRLPKVHIEDLTEGYRSSSPSLFGPILLAKMEQTLNDGNQVILFLNRRAYAPFMICRECGHRWECPKCAVTLSYHRGDQKLKCHHCGHLERTPERCSSCDGVKIKPFGIGTEKVEENVSELFPNAKVARLDRDIAQKKGALEEVIASFRAGETNVLVGTQLVAKGFDFPNVTLVGVIAADLSLNIPDFRAAERTFQLLCQVGGRAGRASKPGEVVIQTFNPTAQAIQSAQNHEFLGFFESTLDERRQAEYPPYVRLINIVFTGENRSTIVGVSAIALAHLQNIQDISILGPADCPLERLQNKWRRHILVKLPNNKPTQIIADALKHLETKGVSMMIDVDPYSLM